MFKKNLELIFSTMFLVSISTNIFCEDNILSSDQNVDFLIQETNMLDENLTYTTDFEENDVFEEESNFEIEDDVNYDDLDMNELDKDNSELTLCDDIDYALTYFKYKVAENIKENAKWYLAGIIAVSSVATAGIYYKFIKKS